MATPDFDLVLSYEYQIRRNVTKQMNEGTTMAAALKQAMADTVIKERYFITPNVYNQLGATRDYPRSRSPPQRTDWWKGGWQGKGDPGKGKKGNKGKGLKGKKGKSLHDKTPDGRQICWRWNSQYERCRFKCGRVHVCMACLGDHPLHACRDSPKDTAGNADSTK